MSSVFEGTARRLMPRLMADVPGWGELEAAADLGSVFAESGGKADINEGKPVVAGSRGGFGLWQHTAGRRTALESFCRLHGLDVRIEDAQYRYHIAELSGQIPRLDYRHVVRDVKNAPDLEHKVVIFELGYEGAGVKNYPARQKGARLALQAYHQAPAPGPQPGPTPTPTPTPAPAPPSISPEDENFAWSIVEAAVQHAWTHADNPLVFAFQMALTALYYDIPRGIDGIFGDHTEAAVRQFQADEGLAVDGKVGPHTWAALMAALKEKSDG